MHSSSYTNSVNAGDYKATAAGAATADEANKVWRIQENTDTFPTNAFGTLEFQGADVHTKKAEVSQQASACSNVDFLALNDDDDALV